MLHLRDHLLLTVGWKLRLLPTITSGIAPLRSIFRRHSEYRSLGKSYEGEIYDATKYHSRLEGRGVSSLPQRRRARELTGAPGRSDGIDRSRNGGCRRRQRVRYSTHPYIGMLSDGLPSLSSYWDGAVDDARLLPGRSAYCVASARSGFCCGEPDQARPGPDTDQVGRPETSQISQ